MSKLLTGYRIYKGGVNTYTVEKERGVEGMDMPRKYYVTVDAEYGFVIECTCRGFKYYHQCKHSMAVGKMTVPLVNPPLIGEPLEESMLINDLPF